MNPLKNTLSIYLYNSTEDEWDYLKGISDKEEQKKAIYSSNKYGDCYLFTQVFSDHSVFISPNKISATFISYFESVSQSKVTVLIPENKTAFISHNLISDKTVFPYLVSLAKQYKKISLNAYASTTQLYDVKQAFERQDIQVELPFSPSKKQFNKAKSPGSKSGIKKCIESINKKYHTDIMIPKGKIFRSIEKAALYASNIYSKNKQIVIKTDKGFAGAGVLLYKKGVLSTIASECNKQILKELQKNAFWKENPIIVEEFIQINPLFSSSFPNVEYSIDKNKKAKMLYYCNMIVSEQGEFYGMEMHKNCLEKNIRTELLSKSKYIVNEFIQNGYQGNFDIDTIVSDKKILYFNESNMRHTGGTDTYCISRKLIGPDFFSKKYVLSRYMDLPYKNSVSFEKIKNILKSVLFSDKTKSGIIINSESVINNKGLSYIIIGNSKKHTFTFEKKMKELLLQYSN